jgi:photosystem II stability/assembly factor-like uncharacterized protein
VVVGVLAALQPLAAHQPHDPMSVVAMSPNYAQDQTLLVGTSALTMPLPLSEFVGMKSTDGGLSFSVMPGLPDIITNSIAFSPAYASDGTAFMGGNAGLYRSNDGGGSWTWAGLSTGNQPVLAVAVSPTFTTSGVVYALTGNGIYSSQDHGKTWKRLPNPSGVTSGLTCLAVSPNYAADATLVLGTSTGIFKSTNWGGQWVPLTSGTTLPLVKSLAFSPAYDTDYTIYAVTFGGGVLVSGNGGSTWMPVNNGLTDLAGTAIALSPNFAQDSTLWVSTANAGVFRSTNRGGAWTLTAATPRPLSNQTKVHYVTLAAGNGPSGIVLFVGTFEGLFTSTNGGQSWTYCNTMPTHLVRDLELSPDYSNDQTVFVSTYGGGTVWSTDGGSTWSFKNTGLINSYTDAVAMSPDYASDQTAFIGTVFGLERIDSGSSTWSMMTMLNAITFPRALGLSPDFPEDSTLFIGTQLGINPPYYVMYNGQVYYNQGLFISLDKGENWEPTNTPCNQPGTGCGKLGPPVDSIAVSPNYPNDQTVFAAGVQTGLLKSTNGAAGPFAQVAPVPLTVDSVVIPVAVSPDYANDQTVLAATSHSGIYKSTDGGSTWQVIPGTNLLTTFSMAFSPDYANDRTLFVGTLQQGLLKSSDGGASLQPTGLPGAFATAVALSPDYADDQTVFAANYTGLYKSTDGGATWSYAAEPSREEEERQFPPGAFNTIIYQGAWQVISDPAASTMQYSGTSETGDSASFTFVGSGVDWIGMTSPSGGSAQVALDGVANATVDLNTPDVQEQQTLWGVRGLPCGPHTVTITANLTAGQSINLDAMNIWQDDCAFTNAGSARRAANSPRRK